MAPAPRFGETRSISVFVHIAGVQTERLLANCLYTIDDPAEILEIVGQLDLRELRRAAQRKATNWLVFTLRDDTRVETDFDQAAGELRVTIDESIHEYAIGDKASERLNHHIDEARPLYEKAYSHGR